MTYCSLTRSGGGGVRLYRRAIGRCSSPALAERSEGSYRVNGNFASGGGWPLQRALVLALLLLAGCAAQEVLVAKSAAVPPGVDLTGSWRLKDEVSSSPRELTNAIRRTDGVNERRVMETLEQTDPRMTRPRRARGGLVHVFLTTGRSLRITQTDAGLFLSFDRAVVEEYRFGENREVRVGPVTAQRVSGWEGREYVVETLDRSGMKLTERLSLSADGQTLKRTIVLRSKKLQEEVVAYEFARIG